MHLEVKTVITASATNRTTTIGGAKSRAAANRPADIAPRSGETRQLYHSMRINTNNITIFSLSNEEFVSYFRTLFLILNKYSEQFNLILIDDDESIYINLSR